MPQLTLFPPPREVKSLPGQWTVPESGIVEISLPPSDGGGAEAVFHAAGKLAALLAAGSGRKWRITGKREPSATVSLRVAADCDLPGRDGYQIQVNSGGVTVLSGTSAGLHNAVQTLLQLARHKSRRWKNMIIRDWPDFPRRGFYLDVSRGKVPARGTLIALVHLLAEWKINEFQLYIENVFEFKSHPDFYADTTPLTAADMRAIDGECKKCGIDFVPSLISLGHFDKILRLPRYRHLAEVEPEELRRQGVKTWCDNPWTLCVTDPAAQKLLAEMYAEFLPNFSSRRFNICCDESWDLGLGRSRQAAAGADGTARLYVDWVNRCAQMAARYGKAVQLWADIIFKHPELLAFLPSDAALLEWGYRANHPFAGHGKLLARCRRRFYVCPGTSTWQSLGGRTDNALANIASAARAGRRHGAEGLLNTDWGDYGHQQLFSVSLVPLAFGAAAAWNSRTKPDGSFLELLGQILPADASGRWATVAADLGNVYRRISHRALPNSSLDWQLFREPWAKTDFLKLADPHRVKKEIARVERHIALLSRWQSAKTVFIHRRRRRHGCPLLETNILPEILFTARLICHTLKRTELRMRLTGAGGKRCVHPRPAELRRARELLKDIVQLNRQYRGLWLRGNRQSRLVDVQAHYKRIAAEYRDLL